MRIDYQCYFDELKGGLLEIGGVCVDDSDLTATFALPLGWSLVFECERYYGPSWIIVLRAPVGQDDRGGREYVLSMLMKAFEFLGIPSYGAPTIKNQVEFLKGEWATIIDSAGFYSDSYDRIALA